MRTFLSYSFKVLALLLFGNFPSFGQLVVYTDRAAWEAALEDVVNENLESVTADINLLNASTTVGSHTFTGSGPGSVFLDVPQLNGSALFPNTNQITMWGTTNNRPKTTVSGIPSSYGIGFDWATISGSTGQHNSLYLSVTGTSGLLTRLLNPYPNVPQTGFIGVISPCGGITRYEVYSTRANFQNFSLDNFSYATSLADNSALAPWAGVDIGNPGAGNSYGYDPCQGVPSYTIETNANNNIPNSDNLGLIGQELCGDFEVTVKVESVTPNGYAGLMAREAGAPGSRMVGLYSNHSPMLRWEARIAANANKAVNFFSRPLPYWLRLVRQGNLFYGYYSFDGVSFSVVTAQVLPMNACLQVGMAAFSNIPGSAATAVFSHENVNAGSLPIIQLPTTEVEQASASREVSLYPNPARDVVTLTLTRTSDFLVGEGVAPTPAGRPEVLVRLRNELGQVRETRRLDGATERFDWPVSHMRPGLYFIEVLEEGQAPQILRFVRVD
ncbi:MAG: hypothetical protein KDD02_20580 [Phaeodactylibacter sp.]|nr:hypothetical protein [Phaeodactylibacter sp.]